MQRLSGRIITRFAVVGTILLCLILIYHRESIDRFDFLYPAYVPIHTKSEATCPPSQWIQGEWLPKSNYPFTSLTNPDEAFAMAGFKQCASNRQVDWHLGSPQEKPDRFPKVFSYEWHGGCETTPFVAEEMVKHLVEYGGWFLLGDSLTEGHFFSISCLLGEHVRAEPFFIDGTSDLIPQHLFLKSDSPIVSRINIPRGFDFNNTPIVTFQRCDFLMRIPVMEELYQTLHNPPKDFVLFQDKNLKTSGPEDYMPVFIKPKNRYKTMIVSTAAWWNTGSLNGLSNGQDAITPELIQFYSDAMDLWASSVQNVLLSDQRRHPKESRRQAIVRGFPSGHDDCSSHHEPWKIDHGHPVEHYNWPSIPLLNRKFEAVVKGYLDIHYVGINHPAQLRPDGHAPWDCLHYATGTGVNEGWTHYIFYYLTNLASRGLLAGKSVLESRPPPKGVSGG